MSQLSKRKLAALTKIQKLICIKNLICVCVCECEWVSKKLFSVNFYNFLSFKKCLLFFLLCVVNGKLSNLYFKEGVFHSLSTPRIYLTLHVLFMYTFQNKKIFLVWFEKLLETKSIEMSLKSLEDEKFQIELCCYTTEWYMLISN